MNLSHRSTLRRIGAGVAAVLVAGGLLLAQSAQAETATESARLASYGTFTPDRYATAAAVAVDTYPDGASNVILATGQDFADALASSGMAGALDAPILLTLSDRLLDVTKQALSDLGASDVYLMGGTLALSQAVEDAVTAAGYTAHRVAGESRFETAAAAGQVIADQATPIIGGGIGSTSGGVTAFLTNGLTFPDAVSSSPVAFAGNLPILLTAKDVLPQATIDAVKNLGIEHVAVVGGTAVISDAVVSQLKSETSVTTQRLAGVKRWDTNIDVVQFGVDEFDMGGATAYLSTGMAYPDALVGGPAAGKNLNRLLLVHPDKVPPVTGDYLQANAATIDRLVAIGGQSAVPDAVLNAARLLAQLDSNQVYNVSPTATEGVQPSTSPLTDEGRRAYTVTGLESGTTYDIALLDPAVVSSSGGNVTISSYQLAQAASIAIETVNGNPVTSGGPAGSGTETKQIEAAANADGELTFSIDSTEQGSAIPFVYLDENTNNELDVDSAHVPTEQFGVGGLTNWVPAEAATADYTAASGSTSRQTVQQVSRAGNYFTAGAGTFYYSSVDLYQVALGGSGATQISMAQFEGLLTSGDVLSIEYQQDGQSIFSVYTDKLADISGITASTAKAVSGGDAVVVSWTPSDQPDTTYTVYRDANRNGTLDNGEPKMGSVADNAPSIQFVQLSDSPQTAQYIVVPKGATSGVTDTPDASGVNWFVSTETPIGYGMVGLSKGTTVATNAGNSAANEGDVWLLSFSQDVKIASNASIVLNTGVGSRTFTNNTSKSTWAADGSTVVITLGPGATTPDTFTYAGVTVASLTGVTDLGGTAPTLQDTALEDDGPDLMLESTTCNAGDSSCTIRFNEPVDSTSATNPNNYSTDDLNPPLSSVSLGADGRTITVTYGGALSATDELGPDGPLAAAVTDDDGQAATQARFRFVLA